jgi:hypothetical protein
MTNILQNWSFEHGWTTDPVTGNQTPNEWRLTRAYPGDPMQSAGVFPGEDPPIINEVLTVPECVHKLQSQLPPDEWLGGEDALILDGQTTYKIFGVGFSATLWQELDLTPGAVVTFRVPIQSHHHGDGSYGANAARIWINLYNSQWATFGDGFPDPAAPEWVIFTASATVPADGHVEVGIDLDGRAEAPVDFFIDAVTLEVEEPEPPTPPECPGAPRIDYTRRYNVIPQDTLIARATDIFRACWLDGRQTVGGSSDDAGIGDLSNKIAIEWDRPQAQRQAYIDFYAQYYPGTVVEFAGDSGEPEPPDPPAPPDPDPDPVTPVVPTGILVAWGTIGGQGQEPLFQTLAAQGAAPPTAKFVQDLGAAAIIKGYSPGVKIIGRKIDVMYNGQRHSVEGFNYNGDPIAQAEARMELLRETMTAYPAVDYWEIVNEILPPTPADIVKICAFFKRALEIAESWGKRLALFSFSTGTPEPEAWIYASPTGVFDRAYAGGHVLSLHEYGLWGRDAYSHLLRFRVLYDNTLLRIGMPIPLYITEYGVPDGDWASADKAQQFKDYDAELSKFPYIGGAHIYCNPWHPPYNTYPVYYPQYIAYAIAIKDRQNG